VRAFIVSAVVTATMACAQPALADSGYSANWAGYAVHGTGVSFHQVSGSWKQPGVSCSGAKHTFSAFWVGMGGYSMSSTALEQIGTEADCNSQGAPVMSAWYEYLPYAVPISMSLRAGDTMSASVVVSGHRVTLTLTDVTRGHTFSKILTVGNVDVSSAEWIVEAPSQCFGQSACTILPLANFGSAAFTAAAAQSADGHAGSISDPKWGTTKLDLAPNGRRYVAVGSGTGVAAIASPLRSDGASFKVAYSRVTLQFGLSQHGDRGAVVAAAAASGPAPSVRVTPRR
jgi:hypothetical protein